MKKITPQKEVSPKKIITINVPVYIIELFNKLKDAGVIQSRSEFCREAVQNHMLRFFNTFGHIIEENLRLETLDPDYDLIDPPGYKNLDALQKLVKDARHFYVDKLKANGGNLRQ